MSGAQHITIAVSLIVSLTAGLVAPSSVLAQQAGAPLAATAAQQLGVRQCLPLITAVAQRAVADAELQDVVVSWDRTAPDRAPFIAMTALGVGDQRATFTIMAMPNNLGQCSIYVERISSSSEPCAVVARREIPTFPGQQLIDNVTVYQNPAQADETYTTIQNPGTCVIIRRQVALNRPA